MSFVLKQNTTITKILVKIQLSVICAHMVDFCMPSHECGLMAYVASTNLCTPIGLVCTTCINAKGTPTNNITTTTI